MPTIEEVEAAWDRFNVTRIPGHDMTNECRLTARILALEAELRERRTGDGRRRNGRSFRAPPGRPDVECLYLEVEGDDLEKLPGGGRKLLLVPWAEGEHWTAAFAAERARLEAAFANLSRGPTGG